MIVIDLYSRTPIYEQIEEQIMLKINNGDYKPGDKLPSIRELASTLGLNVNTVKRAFSELEAKNITVSIQGRGIFVSENAVQNKIVHDEAENEISQALQSAIAKGMTKNEIINIVNILFNN